MTYSKLTIIMLVLIGIALIADVFSANAIMYLIAGALLVFGIGAGKGWFNLKEEDDEEDGGK
jgi:hypothetical protein